jgi:hypothetical protein
MRYFLTLLLFVPVLAHPNPLVEERYCGAPQRNPDGSTHRRLPRLGDQPRHPVSMWGVRRSIQHDVDAQRR